MISDDHFVLRTANVHCNKKNTFRRLPHLMRASTRQTKLTIETLHPLHIIGISHGNNRPWSHRNDILRVNEASGVIESIHFPVRQSFAEEIFLLEALLLTFTICQPDEFVFSVNQSTFGVMFVGAKVVKKLLVGSVVTCHLDVLLVDLCHSERIGLGVLIVTA